MSRWSKLAKMLGVSEDVLKKAPKEAVDTLSKVNTPELATTLKGPERGKYLNALDLIYGDQNTRAKSMGFGDRTWYHGTTAPIEQFEKEALGASTKAASANKGFFFAEDPSTAADYATLAAEKGVNRNQLNWRSAQKQANELQYNLKNKYGFGANAYVEGNYTDLVDAGDVDGLIKMGMSPEDANKLVSDQTNATALYDSYRDSLPDNKIRGLEKDIAKKRYERSHKGPNEFLERDYARRIADTKEKLQQYPEDASFLQPRLERQTQQWNDAKYGTISPEELSKLDTDISGLQKTIEDLNISREQSVIPVRLRGNPLVKNYKGQGYRDESYSDLMTKASEQGKDSVLLKNTYDPADPSNRVKQDIAAVFEPEQVRSVNAAFDPRFKNSSKLIAGAGAVPLSGQDFDLMDTMSNFNQEVIQPLTQPVVSRFNKLKSMFTEPLANQLDLTKDKSQKGNIKQVLDMAVDPTNALGGIPGLAAGAIQFLGDEDEEDEQ